MAKRPAVMRWQPPMRPGRRVWKPPIPASARSPMFSATCKGLHCACCKTFGIGPLLFLLILYVISALNESAIVSLLLHAAMILTVFVAAVSILIGIAYWLLTKTLNRVTNYIDTGRPSYEVRNARASARQATVVYMARPGITNHSRTPVLFRGANEPGTQGQRIVLERRDER